MEELKWLPSKKQIELRRKGRDLSIISNKNRLNILYFLNENSKNQNFNEIAVKLKVDTSNLAYHINLLKKTGFINNSMLPDKEGRTFSYYSITEKGKKMLKLIENL